MCNSESVIKFNNNNNKNWGIPLFDSLPNKMEWLTRSTALLASKKKSEDTTIKNTISVDNFFKYIYTLISVVVSFKSKLVRTSRPIKINRDPIIDHDSGNFADHIGKRNKSIVVFGHYTSSFFI